MGKPRGGLLICPSCPCRIRTKRRWDPMQCIKCLLCLTEELPATFCSRASHAVALMFRV